MKYPQEIYVYVCDYDKDKPILAVATTLAEIPEDISGEYIARYAKGATGKFSVKKSVGK